MAKTQFIILGGGMVAGYAAKELVERGLKPGELTIVSADGALPYERPPLSKGFLAGKDSETGILINPSDWYPQHGIEVALNTVVTGVDLAKKSFRVSSGQIFEAEKLLIATGARARTLNVPGKDLANIFYLRSMDDSRKIRAAAENSKRAVVIGGGFIGMEVAAVLTQKAVHTTMIFPEERVWRRMFTPEMSKFFERYYADRGVDILTKTNVAGFEGKGNVSAVALEGGRTVPCDMAIAGVGAAPVTELFEKTEILGRDGVQVNEFLETGAPGVYAAGDVANYPDTIFEKRRRVEHWDNAVSQGQHWVRVAMGERQPFVHVPYFFSDVFDLSYEFWGDSDGATQTMVRGDVSSSSFSVWWLKGERLIAAFAMNRPDEERNAAPEWIQSKKKVSAARLGEQNRAVNEAVQG
ncbi:MAG TPA: FAD-dependent oxidoreductase [Candidatus Acidoferrales bacterium]|nr:FAD-dependent oxidoreductase [Candidatus Acidoferrales bacterium]